MFHNFRKCDTYLCFPFLWLQSSHKEPNENYGAENEGMTENSKITFLILEGK